MSLDPSGVMMENVCQPLKRYLRNRDDTVKCIVSNLTDDGDSSNDLMEEFCKDLGNYFWRFKQVAFILEKQTLQNMWEIVFERIFQSYLSPVS